MQQRGEIEARRARVRRLVLIAGFVVMGSGCAAPAAPPEGPDGALGSAREEVCTAACYDPSQISCGDEAGFAVTACLTPCRDNGCVAFCEDSYHAMVAQCDAAVNACIAACHGGGPSGCF